MSQEKTRRWKTLKGAENRDAGSLESVLALVALFDFEVSVLMMIVTCDFTV